MEQASYSPRPSVDSVRTPIQIDIRKVIVSLLDSKEEARIEKRDGKVAGPYKAIFVGDTIIIADPMADVESGDTILRRLPNGKDARSVVTDSTFFNQGVGSLGAHYQLKFKKGCESLAQRPTQSINISGAHSVQIGDHNTQSIVSSFEALVTMIDSSNAPPDEKAQAKSLLSKLLQHPLIVSIVGTVAGAVVGS